MATTAPQEVKLTPDEKDLFRVLLEASKTCDGSVTLRVAGGWVRDKLLGLESDDIDIALDTMLGREFAEKVNVYLQGKEQHSAKITVIQANPDQSKHLETARMKINEMWIDLVNLRSETYTQESRVPQMKFGTPEEDASRRDFTVNSMFYNINSGVVEDFTGKGLEDMEKGIIRTPMKAMETFLDDPLRVLRAVRFAARFNFVLEETLQKAASNELVLNALKDKVSKERVGTEVEGMLKGGHPLVAINHLVNLGLFTSVFPVPEFAQIDQDYGPACVRVLEEGMKILEARSSAIVLSDSDRRLLILSALLLPLYRATCRIKQADKKQMSAASYIIRERLKLKAKDADNIDVLHQSLSTIHELVLKVHEVGCLPVESLDPNVNVRVGLGLWVRELKELFQVGAVLVPLLPLADTLVQEESRWATSTSDKDEKGRSARLSTFDTLDNLIRGYDLSEVWKLPPLLNGKEVMKALGIVKGGPILGLLMQKATRWQLAHPQGTKADLVIYLKQNQAQD